MIVNLTLEVDGSSKARILASKLFGAKNVLSVTQVSNEFAESISNLNSDQIRIKSLEDQKKKYAVLAKREKARQSLVKAQQKVRDAMA